MQPLGNRAPRLWLGLTALLLLAVALLNAWVCDDAYITFRTCFNFTHGYGPVYNVGERVQTYTNPLWMLLISGFYAFTGEAFFTSITVSLLLLGGTIWLMSRRIFEGSWAVVLILLCMAGSLSFVEFATSGLENVLNGFLLALFIAIHIRQENDDRKMLWMTLIAALGMVSRMDTALLYLPALALVFWQNRGWRSAGQVLLGFLPFVCWEAFSIIYYGFPFPNTAYAKLNAGLTASEYQLRGAFYAFVSLQKDPLTMVIIGLGIILPCLRAHRKWLPIGIGIALYMAYVVRIGGDFMAGRFFYLPFLGGCVIVIAWLEQRRGAVLPVIVLLLVGWVNPAAPAYNGWRAQAPREQLMEDGVADERGWYRDVSSLMAYSDSLWVIQSERNLDENADAEQEPSYMFWDFIGFMGYGSGPTVSFCDRYALADPLLARLPMVPRPGWRIGHYERAMPRGLRKTLRTGENNLQDEGLCLYYDHLCKITRGPIWSWSRWETIWEINLGHYDALIDEAFYKHPAPDRVHFAAIQQPHPRGEKYRAPGQIEIWSELPLRIELGEGKPFPFFEMSLLSEADYKLVFLKFDEEIAELRLPQQWIGGGLAIYDVQTPSQAMLRGFDAITIEGLGGNEYYALGHLRPIYGIPGGE